MKDFFFKTLLIILIYFSLPSKSQAESTLDFYMNDFYSKSNEASLILKDIETTLKEGSRKKICSKQRKAAELGLAANKSLIKAFELSKAETPMKAIKANQKRWESILNNC